MKPNYPRSAPRERSVVMHSNRYDERVCLDAGHGISAVAPPEDVQSCRIPSRMAIVSLEMSAFGSMSTEKTALGVYFSAARTETRPRRR
jgi:hypothetical protein